MTLLRYLISLIKIYQLTLLGKLISHIIAVKSLFILCIIRLTVLSNLCEVFIFLFVSEVISSS